MMNYTYKNGIGITNDIASITEPIPYDYQNVYLISNYWKKSGASWGIVSWDQTLADDNCFVVVQLSFSNDKVTWTGWGRKPMLCVSYDDSYGEVVDNAKPILDSYGFVGTVYQTTDLIDYVGNTIYLSPSDLLSLQSAGWEIGSHGKAHLNITELNDEELATELGDSKSILEGLGLNITSYATVFGTHVPENIRDLVCSYYSKIRAYGYASYVGLSDFRYAPAGVLWCYNDTGHYALTTTDLDNARDNNLLVVVADHRPGIEGQSTEHLSMVCEYVANNGFEVRTFSDAIDNLGYQNGADIPSGFDSYDYCRARILLYSNDGQNSPTITSFGIGGSSEVATSYSNTGGTGDRTSIIATAKSANIIGSYNANLLVNGLYTGQCFVYAVAVSGEYLSYDFGVGASKVIDEAIIYNSTNGNKGTWKWQGSNNGSDWSDIGSSFVWQGVYVGSSDYRYTCTTLSGNTTGYRYYRILGVSGTAVAGYAQEITFKIADYVATNVSKAGGIARANVKKIGGIAIANVGKISGIE